MKDDDPVDKDAVRASDDTVKFPVVSDNFESQESARDDALANLMGIDDVAEGRESGAPGSGRRHRPKEEAVDVARLQAAAADPDKPPRTGRSGTPLGARAQRKTKEKLTGRKRRKAPWWELPLLVAVAIVIAVLVKTFVVQPFYIPSQSMEKTLHGCPGCTGDRILVNKPIYDLRKPHPGDIVVFDAPPGWNDEIAPQPPSNPVLRLIRGFGQLVGFVPPDGLVLVKRVVAVGGQTVKGDAAGHVFISDHGTAGPWRTLDEHSYVYKDGVDSHAAFGPVAVPKGRLWVMGDHRNDSADSRFHCGSDGTDGGSAQACDPASATVPVDDVIGKAVLIAWPPSRWRTLGTPETFKHAAAGLGGALGLSGSAVVVLPIYLVRRRRRRVCDPAGELTGVVDAGA